MFFQLLDVETRVLVKKISGHDCHQPGPMLLIIKKHCYVIIMLFIYPANPTHVDFIPRGQVGGFVKRFNDFAYIFISNA